MYRRGWLALLLVLSLGGLRSLAAATPPDPVWLPGIYDDGDYDDVVLAVLSLDGFQGDAPVVLGPPAALVARVAAPHLTAPRPVPHSFQESRAPPAS